VAASTNSRVIAIRIAFMFNFLLVRSVARDRD